VVADPCHLVLLVAHVAEESQELCNRGSHF
jgi:hypothetical protein